MKRRNFIGLLSAAGGGLTTSAFSGPSMYKEALTKQTKNLQAAKELSTELVVAGGGLGGCAAAMAALRNGIKVIMTEETDWIGGQLTQQGVSCPDEHPWIENYGCTELYRELRSKIRAYYLGNYPLTQEAKVNEHLNPGNGAVSRLCLEPKVALAVLRAMFAPYLSSGKLILLLRSKIIKAEVDRDDIKALTAKGSDGKETILTAPYFIDATELGDLLPLSGTEYITGAESRNETNELHAAQEAQPDNNQAFTYCFAMDYIPGADNTIDKPGNYNCWRNFIPDLSPPWPGRLLNLAYSSPSDLKPKDLGFDPRAKHIDHILNLWNYRRIIDKNNFVNGTYNSDITIVNWPQNDYLIGNIIDAPEKTQNKYFQEAKQLSLSLFYWLQTEVPRPDGKTGWPGLRLRGDLLGTDDGLAKYPYIRESRRIKAMFTILEEHVGVENRALVSDKSAAKNAAYFYDSVGIGYYHIDLHPSYGGNNYIDMDSMPFQIPLGALMPVRMKNLIPANKNIGTTHITNGCYRLHPVEWNIGESAGMVIAYALNKNILPRDILEQNQELQAFQQFIRSQGISTRWPKA